MNEEEKQALEILKGLEFEEYDWYVKTDKIEGHANDVVEKVEKALQTILNLVDKQQKEIERIKNFNYNTYIRKDTIRHIRDKAECMDYYSLNDVIDDLSKLLGE